MIHEDLFGDVLNASGLEVDSRWKKWVKWIDSVDKSRTNGYCFVGEFLPEGTLEIELQIPRLLLVASEVGSNKYRTTHYQVVQMNPDGELFPLLPLYTTSDPKGWALRLRDNVAAELDAIANLESIDPGFTVSDLWTVLGDYPIDSEEKIDMQFLHFTPGTHREEIWHWFEDTFPEFSVAEEQGAAK